jgi:hypothetical protein
LSWLSDITKIGGKRPEGIRVQVNEKGEALSIMPLAVSKAATEASDSSAHVRQRPRVWAGLPTKQPGKKLLQYTRVMQCWMSAAFRLIKKQNPDLPAQVLSSLIEKFQQSVALDTVRNEYLMHSRLLPWMTREQWRNDVNSFNEKVYAELFLTPRSDPWLGLLMADAYTAIDNGGGCEGIGV